MIEVMFSQMHQKGLWVNNDFHTFEASNMTSPDSSHFFKNQLTLSPSSLTD